ncbi:MAG: hypothetical protein AVDCRST_MAG70-651 [uncultured Thermomicrobiales bacterium]|uniref:Uncharacterized protein n=1 Tax=uncultured Thermomicrobiales bacterium TaxID=1645740 RepID=A0A6J4UHN5_9BACT|nr:MAG: hypothetical protein AVDCRST_MAG70-651 [uncultured Thermomicrobiales bacterium]
MADGWVGDGATWPLMVAGPSVQIPRLVRQQCLSEETIDLDCLSAVGAPTRRATNAGRWAGVR